MTVESFIQAYKITLTFDGTLDGVAQIDGLSVVGVHESDEAVDQVGDILKGPGLSTVAVDLKVELKMMETEQKG